MKKNVLAILLAFLMTLSLLPMNASAEEKDGAAAAVPDEAKFTLQLKGQRYDPSRNDSSGFSYIGGCYVNIPFTCERCLEDPDHPSRHTVLAGEVKSRFHEMQSKVEQIAGANMLVIGLTQEYEFEGTPLAVHEYDAFELDEENSFPEELEQKYFGLSDEYNPDDFESDEFEDATEDSWGGGY